MNKKIGYYLAIIFILIISNSNAQSMKALRNQSDSFSRVTKNKIWSISKYVFKSVEIKTNSASGADSIIQNIPGKQKRKDSLVHISKQTDKKSLFDNIGFKFNRDDSTRFRITIGGKDSLMGQWVVQNNNNILFSMPLIVDASGDVDTANTYNQAVKLLCSWPLKRVEVQSSHLKFQMMDPVEGEAIIEFKGENCADCKVRK